MKMNESHGWMDGWMDGRGKKNSKKHIPLVCMKG
jgi:hypothetical protein